MFLEGTIYGSSYAHERMEQLLHEWTSSIDSHFGTKYAEVDGEEEAHYDLKDLRIIKLMLENLGNKVLQIRSREDGKVLRFTCKKQGEFKTYLFRIWCEEFCLGENGDEPLEIETWPAPIHQPVIWAALKSKRFLADQLDRKECQTPRTQMRIEFVD